VNQRFIVSDDFTWRVGVGVRYNGDEVDSSETVRNPPVTLVDLMAELSFRDWDISLNVNNLADKEYYSEAGPYIVAPAQTRVIFGTVSKSF
jgi:iron complex outermembrane recepter protein